MDITVSVKKGKNQEADIAYGDKGSSDDVR